MQKNYTVDCSVYTGIITGVNILSESGITTTSYTQSSMIDNLENILVSDQTLKQVSLRLYARIMVHGDPNKDNIYTNASSYSMLYNHGKEIHHLIDKSSTNDSINEQRTYENLVAYEKNDTQNYVYGIYQYQLPYVNRASLQKILVDRNGSSDMLEISYTNNDPGITYQTLRILVEEFIRQYQELRFGETNNVIAYFEKELARLNDSLRLSEDNLTKFRVNKLVINYGEETKSVTALSRDYELQYWTSVNNFEVADSLKLELEKRMGLNSDILRNNNEYLYYNELIGELTNQLTMANYYPESVSETVKDSLKTRLNTVGLALERTIQQYGDIKHSKEGISNDAVISEWLNQVIAYKKAEAELKILKDRKVQMDRKYTHFAPIGSELTRMERKVNIVEQQYLAILGALNSARLRQKSLQMTSATLKVMNDPSYPLTPLENYRKRIILGAFVASFIFIIFFFLIVEFLDHTLRHKFKAEMLTGTHVIGAFTRMLPIYRKYHKLYSDFSAKVLCNYTTTYFQPNENKIINIISNEQGEGKSFVLQQMAEHFIEQGMEVKQYTENNFSQSELKLFIQSIKQESNSNNKIVLVEYPSWEKMALNQEILQSATLNIQVIDSRRTWKNTDQELLERIKEMSGEKPVFIVLNYTKRDATEDLNGLMPPYTFFRRFFYRISQLGLTALDKHKTNV